MKDPLELTENDIKQQVKDYLAARGIFNYYLLQGMGAYKGVPDRIAHINGKVHYLEIKKPKGKLSPYQVAFKEQCERDGVPYHAIYQIEDLMEVI